MLCLRVFFTHSRPECVNHERYATREAAKASIFDYIEAFYNRQRLHSSNGYLLGTCSI